MILLLLTDTRTNTWVVLLFFGLDLVFWGEEKNESSCVTQKRGRII
jgi:hypothetical protein